MLKLEFLLVSSLIVALPQALSAAEDTALGKAAAPYFKVGAALNGRLIARPSPAELEAIVGTFTSITSENEMKPESVQPEKGRFTFDAADRFVAFGERHGMKIIGHCLVWCQQTPAWMNRRADGSPLSRDEAIENMRTHIRTVVGRYKGRVHGWDVVNEAWGGDGRLRRDSFWYQAIGEDYLELAFRFAHEADPNAELYYNDFNVGSDRAKCDAIVRMVRDFKAKGVRIDAVGMQTHINLDWPSIRSWMRSAEDLIAAGVRISVSEMDVSVLPAAWNVSADVTRREDYAAKYDPYRAGLPEEKAAQLSKRYLEFFRFFLEKSKDVDHVTVWGLTDAQSWLNNFPVKGRVDYPLFFDRNAQPKAVLRDVVKLVREWKPRDAGTVFPGSKLAGKMSDPLLACGQGCAFLVGTDGRIVWSKSGCGNIHRVWQKGGWVYWSNGALYRTDILTGKTELFHNPCEREGVYGFEVLDNGNVVVAENGTDHIVELKPDTKEPVVRFKADPRDADGKMPNEHHHFRMVRKTPAGTYLVCCSGACIVREYDPTGKLLWEQPVPRLASGHAPVAFDAIRRQNGNTLVSHLGAITEFTPDHQVAWTFSCADAPELKLDNLCGLWERENGNLVVGTYANGDENGVRTTAFEVTRDKKIVWCYAAAGKRFSMMTAFPVSLDRWPVE